MPKQPKTIDIVDDVMKRIDRDGVRMRSKRYFVLQKFAQRMLFAVIIGLSLLSLLAVSYSLRYDVFTEYLTVPGGVGIFLGSLPWAGIVMSIVSVVAVVWVGVGMREAWPKLELKQVLASLVIFVATATALGGIGSTTRTPDIFAFASHFSDVDPVRLEGTIASISENTITLKDQQGERTLSVMNLDPNISEGDRVLLLGTEQNQVLVIKAFKMLEEAPAVVPKIEPMPILEEEQPTPKSTVTNLKPAPQPKPKTVAPVQATPTKTITITGTSKHTDGIYKVTWEANFLLEKGFKLVWGTSVNPVYPGSQYYYDGSAAASGVGYVKKTEGTGTYYVRVCQYLGGSCGVYSNQVKVTF